MPQISTANALTDFDLCLALAQSSIDTQLDYAWKAWKRRTNFKDTIDIFKLRIDGELEESNYGLSALVAPLSVSLAVPNGKMGQVMVNLTLQSGKVVYFDERKGRSAEHPIENWSVSFVTDLEKAPVDLRALQVIDPAASQTVEDVIRSTGLPESVFSIEYLFLKLTDIDLMLSDNKNIKIPSSVPSLARAKTLSMLNLLLQGDLGKYVMGTVVRRNTRQATPTFAMTDFVFDVTPDWTVERASTLNYLGQLGGRRMPGDTSAARLKLRDGWVRPQQLDGTDGNVSGIMAINSSSFLDNFLMPQLQKALWQVDFNGEYFQSGIGKAVGAQPPPPKRTGLTWRFSDRVTHGLNVDAEVTMRYIVDQGYELDCLVKPSSNVIALKGRIFSNINYRGLPRGETDLSKAQERMTLDGHQDITGTITLTGSGIGSDFKLGSQLNYKLSDPIIDKNEQSGFSVIRALAKLFRKDPFRWDSPDEAVREGQKSVANSLRASLQGVLDGLDMNLKQHAFIPPGGGVFVFQNPAFSNAGDLFFEVIYRAP